MNHIKSLKSICRCLLPAAIMAVSAIGAYALPTSTYSTQSVLSQGKWVKISVPRSGVYKITKSQLASWGFTDLSKVRVYGYGGQRIPDRLSADNFIDDLPMIQTETVADGVVFYGVGPETWVSSGGNYYHRENNIYTNDGYYFVTDSDAKALPIETQGSAQPSAQPVDYFTERLHYENDLTSPGEAGYVLVGENLKQQNHREVAFTLTDLVEGSTAWFECTMVVQAFNGATMQFSTNGTRLPVVSTDKIAPVSNSGYVHANYTVTSHTFKPDSKNLKLKVGITNPTEANRAWIDYVSVNYQRQLRMPTAGHLCFSSASTGLKLQNASNEVRVWDVTNPKDIKRINAGAYEQSLVWENDYTGMRNYVAWSPTGNLPAPGFVSIVSNQNIHGVEPADMVILTLPEYRSQAERLAQLHRSAKNPLSVTVLSVNDIYNEFSSGSADVSGLRKCLKMIYDRGVADGKPLRYALLMGRATYDNRHLTSQFSQPTSFNTIPCWLGGAVKIQFSDNDAFGTDDFLAMLDDNSGTSLGIDNLSIAVGRMPVTSASEAESYITKLSNYMHDSKDGTWKNSFVFLADDGDSGVHAQQTETMVDALLSTPNTQSFVSKVYVDAYERIGGVSEGGRNDLYRLLDEGTMWLNYCGHANNHSWTAEGLLTFNDINNMYIKKMPVLFAATCSFLRWDSNIISGGELMFHEPNGGTIATISATRPVYIADNGLLSKAFGHAITKRDENGNIMRLGDIYRTAKNNILTESGEHRSNSNRLRYVLMGDPAMQIALPSNIVTLDKINGKDVVLDDQITLQALEKAVVSGSVRMPDGTVIDNFNGKVQINIYDAERSITTRGEGNDNVKFTFEQHGDLLFSGYAEVNNGHFDAIVTMPGEITENFRVATMNMYAVSTDRETQAVGVNRDFYVYGLDTTVEADVVPPVIESMVLNEASFTDGDDVNVSPLLIAEISDNNGINLSTAGIGHQMVVTLDDRTTFTDVSLFYTPATDGTASGVINYQLKNITPGEHTLQLKIWDTAANSVSKKIKFNVVENLTPTIYKVYTDENPASTQANFYVSHNRPEAEVDVTLTVYDMLGRRIWQTSTTVPSDMHTSYPISWNLNDASGRRVPRGIYLYRATLSTADGDSYDTATQRLAVTAQ